MVFREVHRDWLTGSLIQELALKYNLAVVMPAGENSFYLNGKGTGRGYETFTAVELPAYCQKTFGLSDKPEDNFIGGLSMGGFGAIHTALKYPEYFGKMFGLSSALIVNGIKGMKGREATTILQIMTTIHRFSVIWINWMRAKTIRNIS